MINNQKTLTIKDDMKKSSFRTHRLQIAIVLLIAICFFGATNSFAAVIDVGNCLQASVNAAIQSASAGDTVKMGAGTCTWGAGGSFVTVDKPITLEGDGQGRTTINLSSTSGTYAAAVIRISAAATVKSFTIKAPSSGAHSAFNVGANNFRITDIEYRSETSGRGYFAYVGSYGLIDNCIIHGAAGNQELIFARGPSNSWQTAHSMGRAENLFIEYNQFSGHAYVTDINANGRAVVRYNTILGPQKIDGHGKCSNYPARGVRHMEIYNNHWLLDDNYTHIELRGGTGRIFNNVSESRSGYGLYLNEYSSFQSGCGAFDGCQSPSDYPIDDQIGVGRDPKSANSAPVYLWGNIKNGQQWGHTNQTWNAPGSCPSSGYVDFQKIIKMGRDYFESASKPAALSNYAAYACPHPLAGYSGGECLEDVAGRSGYIPGSVGSGGGGQQSGYVPQVQNLRVVNSNQTN